MYSFTDSIEQPQYGSKPAEAVSIDGTYIEDMIPGYQTLYVTGREGLAYELETLSVGSSDGERIISSRYPSRTLTVGFQLLADNDADFRLKFNKLNNYLSVEEADFVFYDEQDKFFVGTPIADIEVDPGTNKVVGEWQIYCADPFKYSIEPIVAEPVLVENTSAEFVIDYKGTYPSKPVLQASFAGALEDGSYSEDGDCGFVAFVDADENIIQLGNPEAIDMDAYAAANTLVNQKFTKSTGWVTDGSPFGGRARAGSVAVNQAIADTYWNKGKGQTLRFMKPSYGSGSAWHGPMLSKNVSTFINFELSAVMRMCATASNQYGVFELSTRDANGKVVAGIVIEKSASGTKASVRYVIDNAIVNTVTIDLSQYNVHFGYTKRTQLYKTQYYDKKKKKWVAKKNKNTSKTRKVKNGYSYTSPNLNIKIKKIGNTVTFNVGATAARSFTIDGVDALVGTRVSAYFGQHATKAALHTNAVNTIKLVRQPSGGFSATSNVFTAGDMVEADCNDASIVIMDSETLEGHSSPQYGALGNDWEDFALTPGVNQIKGIWSDWVNPNYKPTLKIIYNEVFI